MSVVQVADGWRLLDMVVMSGEEHFWLGLFGILVCELVLRVRWLEFVRISSIMAPLVSVSFFEFHNGEWALKSPVMTQLSSEMRCVRQAVMVCFSVGCPGCLVSLGGM